MSSYLILVLLHCYTYMWKIEVIKINKKKKYKKEDRWFETAFGPFICRLDKNVF